MSGSKTINTAEASASRRLTSRSLDQNTAHTSKRKGKAKQDNQQLADAGGAPDAPVVNEEEHGLSPQTPWKWTSLSDARNSKNAPLFTQDGSYFFSVVGSSVKIHSSTTGDILSTVSANSGVGTTSADTCHTAAITSTILNPGNTYQLITGSLDGTIRIWDVLDGALLQTIDIGQPIHRICAHESLAGYVFACVGRISADGKKKKGRVPEDNNVVLRVSLKPSDALSELAAPRPAEIMPIGKTRFPMGMGISASGVWLVVVGGHKAYVAQTSALKRGFTKFVSPEALTCLALHPSEDLFSTGDKSGVIRSWYCLRDDFLSKEPGVEKRAQTTTLHWHAHAVSALTYTPNGAYLLSGGEEAVLVVWQLHSGKKEFVPRVGAPILSIGISAAREREEEYFLSLADASYTIVSSATMKIARVFSGIKLEPTQSWDSSRDSNCVPLAVHHQNSTIILPSSHPSSLQAYSLSTSKVLFELEISPSNRVSRREDVPVEPSRVTSCVLSATGHWMATIDKRETSADGFRGEVCLKIWWWDTNAGHWILNTRINRPHGLYTVTSLVFNPSLVDPYSSQLITTGDDGTVKAWRIRSAMEKDEAIEHFWVLRSSLTYRADTPKHATWSPDGSLLAVSFGPHVVFYEPTTNIVLHTLTSIHSENTLSAHFVGPSGRYIAVVSAHNVLLWDLLDHTVRWHYRSKLSIVKAIPHPLRETIAIFTEVLAQPDSQPSTGISVFQPASSEPVHTYSVPFRLRDVAWFTPSTPLETASFTLLGITHSWEVVLLGDEVRVPEDVGSQARDISTTPGAGRSRTLFQDIFGESAFSKLTVQENPVSQSQSLVSEMQRANNDTTRLLSAAPAYLMPPLETLYDAFISEVVHIEGLDSQLRGNIVEAGGAVRDGEDEDVDMDVGDDDKSSTGFITGARFLDRVQMDDFIELFRYHAIQAPAKLVDSHSSGTEKPNGIAKPKVNGVYNTSSTLKPNSAMTTRVPDTLVEPTSSPTLSSSSTLVGKKRKKPLVS